MTAAIMKAFWDGVSEETIMRVWDLTHAELTAIIVAN